MNDEIKKMIVHLGFAVVLTVITVKVQRAASSPDFGRAFAMKKAWAVKRYAQYRADAWQNIANQAATTYNGLKP